MQKRYWFVILLFSCFLNSKAQLEQYTNYGFNVGFVSAFGTHVQRFGIVLQGYYVYQFAQVNASVRLYDNFKDLGPKGEHPEFSSSLGLCLGYGKKNADVNTFLSSIGNQTGYKNSVAYSFNVWFNTVKTSQITGVVAFQFNKFSVITENDLLAKPILDRFRTGAFLLQYQDKNIQYAVNCTMWTGQMGSNVRNDSLFPYSGYLNIVNGRYANVSHGLLSAQVKFSNEYGQYIQANVGVDAEQVRNVVQNRLIHDMIILPRKWYKPINSHVPMIDTEGGQYLYRKTQKVRKPKLFLNGYTSPNIFY